MSSAESSSEEESAPSAPPEPRKRKRRGGGKQKQAAGRVNWGFTFTGGTITAAMLQEEGGLAVDQLHVLTVDLVSYAYIHTVRKMRITTVASCLRKVESKTDVVIGGVEGQNSIFPFEEGGGQVKNDAARAFVQLLQEKRGWFVTWSKEGKGLEQSSMLWRVAFGRRGSDVRERPRRETRDELLVARNALLQEVIAARDKIQKLESGPMSVASICE